MVLEEAAYSKSNLISHIVVNYHDPAERGTPARLIDTVTPEGPATLVFPKSIECTLSTLQIKPIELLIRIGHVQLALRRHDPLRMHLHVTLLMAIA